MHLTNDITCVSFIINIWWSSSHKMKKKERCRHQSIRVCVYTSYASVKDEVSCQGRESVCRSRLTQIAQLTRFCGLSVSFFLERCWPDYNAATDVLFHSRVCDIPCKHLPVYLLRTTISWWIHFSLSSFIFFLLYLDMWIGRWFGFFFPLRRIL